MVDWFKTSYCNQLLRILFRHSQFVFFILNFSYKPNPKDWVFIFRDTKDSEGGTTTMVRKFRTLV